MTSGGFGSRRVAENGVVQGDAGAEGSRLVPVGAVRLVGKMSAPGQLCAGSARPLPRGPARARCPDRFLSPNMPRARRWFQQLPGRVGLERMPAALEYPDLAP